MHEQKTHRMSGSEAQTPEEQRAEMISSLTSVFLGIANVMRITDNSLFRQIPPIPISRIAASCVNTNAKLDLACNENVTPEQALAKETGKMMFEWASQNLFNNMGLDRKP